MTSIDDNAENTVPIFYDGFVSQLSDNTYTVNTSNNYGISSAITNAGEFFFIGDTHTNYRTVQVNRSDATNAYFSTNSVTGGSHWLNFSKTSVPNFGRAIDTDVYGSNVIVGGNNHVSVWSQQTSSNSYTETCSVSDGSNASFGFSVSLAKETNSIYVVGDPATKKITVYEGSTLKVSKTESSDDNFGYSVAITGDSKFIAVGAPGPSWGNGNTGVYQGWGNGKVYIYEYDGNTNTPTLTQKKVINGSSNSTCGYSVAFSTINNILAVGSPTENLNTTDGKGGSIRVYQKSITDNTTWDQIGNTINHSNAAGNLLHLSYNGKRLCSALEKGPFKHEGQRPRTYQVYDYNNKYWAVHEYIEGEFVDNVYGHPTSMSLNGLKLVLSAKMDVIDTSSTYGQRIGNNKSSLVVLPSTIKIYGNTTIGGTISCKDLLVGGGVIADEKHSGMIVFSDTTGDEDKIAKIVNRKYDGESSENDGSELLIMKNGDAVDKPDRIRVYGNQVVLQGGGSLTQTDPYNEVFEDSYEFMCDPALTVSNTNVVNVGLDTGRVDFIVKYSNSVFKINGKTVELRLHKGVTYRFDQSDYSNQYHRLKFVNRYLNMDSTTYGISQTLSGTPGTSGAYTDVTFTSDAPTTGIKIYDSGNNDSSTTNYGVSNINISIPSARLNVTGHASIDNLNVTGDASIAEYIKHLGESNTHFGFPHDDAFIITTNGTERLRVNSSGNIGIGTNSPNHKLHVDGNIYASGNVTAYSDLRNKKNLKIIEDPVSKIEKINGYTYEKDNISYTGLVAQELLEVLPEAVSGTEKTGYGIAYGNMAGIFVESIKELNAKIKTLENEINYLRHHHHHQC